MNIPTNVRILVAKNMGTSIFTFTSLTSKLNSHKIRIKVRVIFRLLSEKKIID